MKFLSRENRHKTIKNQCENEKYNTRNTYNHCNLQRQNQNIAIQRSSYCMYGYYSKAIQENLLLYSTNHVLESH